LWFFAAVNPQYRKNFFLTQTFNQETENKITTPFYAGKLTWGINDKNTFTFSTFGDFTKQKVSCSNSTLVFRAMVSART
jgi:hypothetical protein